MLFAVADFFTVDFFATGFFATGFFATGFFATDRLLLATFLAETGFLVTFFLLAAGFLVFFLRDFEEAALLAPAFFLLALAGTAFFLVGFFAAGFLRAAVVFFDDFFVDAFFRVTFDFLPVGFFRPTAFFFEAAFLRTVPAFLRILLAFFFAGIVDSYRSEKNAGLYIACVHMEAYFQAIFGLRRDCAGRLGKAAWQGGKAGGRQPLKAPAGGHSDGSSAILSSLSDNRFIARITLHYIDFTGPWRKSTQCV